MKEFIIMLPSGDDLRLRISVAVEEDNRFPTPLELPRWEEVEPVKAAVILGELGLAVSLADEADLAEVRRGVIAEGGAAG